MEGDSNRDSGQGTDWARVGRWVLTLAVAAGAIVFLVRGKEGLVDAPALIEAIRGAGVWGAVAYVVVFAFVQPLGLSAHIFCLAAAVIWPAPLAFALALAGAVGTSVVSFGFARYVAFDWVQAKLPPRIRRYERWVVERGLLGVLGLRLLTFTMHPVQFMMGVVRIPFRTMMLGTVLGFAPAVAVDVFLGGEVLDFLLSKLP